MKIYEECGNVCVDGRNLARSVSGIARLIQNTTHSLAEVKINVSLVAPSPLHSDYRDLFTMPHVTVKHDYLSGIFGRFLWGEYQFPRHVRDLQSDLVWAPAHRLSAHTASFAPTVLTVHDMVWKFAPETMSLYRRIGDRILTGRAIRNATLIVTVSKRTADDLAVHFPRAKDKIRVVPNIVPTRVSPAPVCSLSKLGITWPYCLFVGTLEPRKNLVRCIKAFLRVPKEVRGDMRFVIAGGRGWLTNEIDKVLTEAGQDIKAIGKVDEPTLSRLYANCSFLVMPSLYEGFGYPVIEAQQYGKRVLTSENSSMAEIGSDSVVLVDPLDVVSISEGIERCLTEDNSAYVERSMQNAARFKPEFILPQLLAVFNEAHVAWKR